MSPPQAAYFTYRHQPLKALYIVYAALVLFLVRTPYWAVTNLLPAWRPRRSWPLSRVLKVNTIREVLRISFQTSIGIFLADSKQLAKSVGFVWIEPDPTLIGGEIKAAAKINDVEPARIGGVWYGQRGPDGRVGQRAGPDERVIFELHGGGWVIGNATRSWDSAYMCDEMIKYADGYTRALQIEYRLAQTAPFPAKNGFPAALIDAIAGYNYLVNVVGFKPANILVSGESAGGALAFALTRYLVKSRLLMLPPPGALFLLSPSGDFGRTYVGAGSSVEKNNDSDYVQWFFKGYGVRALLGNMPLKEAFTNSWISPAGARVPRVAGEFAGMPPTLIMAGGAEYTLDEQKVLRDRLVEDNGRDAVAYVELPDTTHIVLTEAWHEPERTQGYEAFARWVDGLAAQK
ncbi:hypothetical protein EVJ58_g616 [Rhodofomes roseus]|uniref:Alpha/beta hydrolase fold-3 domain-containing protein n=1 Tax=Rhodofomes roseus TaxID=34475 RepID=A0A4Y9Z4S2_9APHY|nr:hypothetical protein EVJ58_g616 [Rhodofomes roseus]